MALSASILTIKQHLLSLLNYITVCKLQLYFTLPCILRMCFVYIVFSKLSNNAVVLIGYWLQVAAIAASPLVARWRFFTIIAIQV